MGEEDKNQMSEGPAVEPRDGSTPIPVQSAEEQQQPAVLGGAPDLPEAEAEVKKGKIQVDVTHHEGTEEAVPVRQQAPVADEAAVQENGQAAQSDVPVQPQAVEAEHIVSDPEADSPALDPIIDD